MGPSLLPAAVLLAVVTLGTQGESSRCRFADVVRAPGEAPAMLDRSTWQWPDFSGLVLPMKSRSVAAWLRISASGRVTDVCGWTDIEETTLGLDQLSARPVPPIHRA